MIVCCHILSLSKLPRVEYTALTSIERASYRNHATIRHGDEYETQFTTTTTTTIQKTHYKKRNW